MERILAVGAHIDDVEIGCGGTLLKHKEQGDYICVAAVKADCPDGGDSKLRQEEQVVAAELIGSDLIMLPGNISITDIVNKLDKINPTIIYFPYKIDHHQDHYRAFQAAMATGRRPDVGLFGYLVTTSYEYYPNYFSIIDIEKKKKLVSIFKTQIERKDRYVDMFVNQNRFFGTLVDEDGIYAEGFVQYKKVWR